MEPAAALRSAARTTEPDAKPTLRGLAISGPAEPWAGIGLALEGPATRVGEVTLAFGSDGAGIRGWQLEGADGGIDGLEAAPVDTVSPAEDELGAVRLDHVVVLTPDVDRTVAAFEDRGIELRRERAGEHAGKPVRQAFFRLGEVILEVVGPEEPEAGGGPARFWGLVIVVRDLEAAGALLGDRLGRIKDAVQPGHRIATVRPEAGLGVPVALISA